MHQSCTLTSPGKKCIAVSSQERAVSNRNVEKKRKLKMNEKVQHLPLSIERKDHN